MRKALLLFLVGTFSISCSSISKNLTSEDLLYVNSSELEPPEDLTPYQVDRDLEILSLALTKAYGGRDFLPPGEFIKALEKIKNLRGKHIKNIQFCESIAKIFNELSDSHLQIRINGNRCLKSVQKSDLVGPNIYQRINPPWRIDYKKVKNARIPILSITAMLNHEDPAWAGFLDSVKKVKATAPVLIIDLRGNDGGDDQ